MADTWITDMRHYLDASGELPDLPGPALNLALFQGSIVAWVSSRSAQGAERTNVNCRRRPGGQRCPGEIHASMDGGGGAVDWVCPACGDGGVIRGWQDTRWDRRAKRAGSPR
jgi:hypothetical protein